MIDALDTTVLIAEELQEYLYLRNWQELDLWCFVVRRVSVLDYQAELPICQRYRSLEQP